MNSHLSSLNSHFSFKKGFTLIELLVVIAIIGLLTAFLVANFVGVKQRARDAQRKSDLRNIQAALEIYRSDQGVYRSGLPACDQIWQDGATYMQKVPCDPLNTSPFTYKYDFNSGTGGYTLGGCLENANDSQKDNPISACGNGVRFTLKNP